MTLAQRIKNIRKQFGLSQTDFAEKIGITQTSLSQIEGEKNGISYDVFKGIIEKFDVDPTWLMDGTGNMMRHESAKKRTGAIPLVVAVDREDEEENIVVVDKKAAAGYLQGQQDPDYIAKLPSFRLPGFTGKTFRAFEIIGDSMLPGIKPSDMIVGSYMESLKDIKKGEVYIGVLHDGSIVAKRIVPIGGDKYEFRSDNTSYDPYYINAEDIAQLWKAEARITKQLDKPSEGDKFSALEQRLLDLEKKMK
ncbi:MAG TPA: helix-turn-helix domain-containing protein [Bacteroidia bacterium]|jgi:transcriptional regulator with XRE-family HTH domain|nr:helix-turn-helix domain-containing protein [Bacteroidia bacterium]